MHHTPNGIQVRAIIRKCQDGGGVAGSTSDASTRLPLLLVRSGRIAGVMMSDSKTVFPDMGSDGRRRVLVVVVAAVGSLVVRSCRPGFSAKVNGVVAAP